MKIATWNVNSLKVRLPQVLQWLASSQPDILALQETKLTDEKFPAPELAAAGFDVIFNGQKTYNGVALLSRIPGIDVRRELPGYDDPQRRVLAATFGGVRLIDLYVPNGQAVGTDKYAYKLEWLDALAGWLRSELDRHPRLIALGDFNIAPQDRDVHDPEEWAGQIMCSEAERQRLGALLELGLEDVFRLFEQEDKAFS